MIQAICCCSDEKADLGAMALSWKKDQKLEDFRYFFEDLKCHNITKKWGINHVFLIIVRRFNKKQKNKHTVQIFRPWVRLQKAEM